MKESDTLANVLKTYLEGLQEQILYHVQRIEELHALREEMAQIQRRLHKIEQGSFAYEWVEKESTMSEIIVKLPLGRPKKRRLFLEGLY